MLYFYLIAGFEVYFPMTDIELNLPLNEKSQSIFSKIAIGQFLVLSVAENSPALGYTYTMDDNDLLRINGTSGEVFMRDDYKASKETTKYTITATHEKNPQNMTKLSHMSLELTPLSEQEYCDDLENVCFWSSAHYVVMEDVPLVGNAKSNFQPVLVGSLNPRGAKYLCPYMDLKYQLLNSTQMFSLRNNLLVTRQPLDFESLDASQQTNLSVDINCLVQVTPNRTEQYRKLINIQVIDRNDNGPVLLNDTTIFNFHLESAYFNAVCCILLC